MYLQTFFPCIRSSKSSLVFLHFKSRISTIFSPIFIYPSIPQGSIKKHTLEEVLMDLLSVFFRNEHVLMSMWWLIYPKGISRGRLDSFFFQDFSIYFEIFFLTLTLCFTFVLTMLASLPILHTLSKKSLFPPTPEFSRSW